MHDKYIGTLPDTLPDSLDVPVEMLADIRAKHATLKLMDTQNHRRKTELFEKHGIMLRPEKDTESRLNLLIEMFIGHISPERLNFEIKWQELVRDSLEVGYAEYLEMRREAAGSKDLFVPGKGIHKVKPAKEEPDAGQPEG